jgi:P4 family phage/plasmid primase-like protien
MVECWCRAGEVPAMRFSNARAGWSDIMRGIPRKPLEIATKYLAEGLMCVPVPYREKAPVIKKWQNLRLDTTEKLKLHFNGNPGNIGVLLGPPSGNLVDVDLDYPECLHFARIFLPETRRFGHTSNPLSHWLFKVPDTSTITNFISEKHKVLEIRAAGQTVFPGSTHKDTGEPILWGDNRPIRQITFQELRLCCAYIATGAVLARAWPRTEGHRHFCSMALAGFLLRAGMADELAQQFIDAVNTIAENHKEVPTNAVKDTRAALDGKKKVTGLKRLSELLGANAAITNIPEWLDCHGQQQGEAEKEIAEPAEGGRPRGFYCTEETYTLANEMQPEAELRPVQYSDDALAEVFSEQYQNDFRFVPEWGWLSWDGTRWKKVPEVVVMDDARLICRQQAHICGGDPSITAQKRPPLARVIGSARTVAAVVRLASGDPRHLLYADKFDTDVWAFNTPGGTIDLRTGRLRSHRREDYITKISNATPQGDCPLWRAFLDQITKQDTKLQGYLQRLMGYALVGDPSEESLDMFYGGGGNGKGTFLTTNQFVFGEYATVAASETFMEAKGERHPTDIAKLAGARLVIAQEVDEGQQWNETRVKTMTGRDVMTARFMRRDHFDFIPQFTLIISGNHKPSLKSVDRAWRRRLHLVPFVVTIPASEQDPNLKNKLQQEADGILRWAVEGCSDWQKQGLNPPEIVLAATEEYLASEDTFEIWISECCLRGHEGYEEPTAWLYESHKHWKQERGERSLGSKNFSQRMSNLGFRPDQRTSGDRARIFLGIRLTDDERCHVKAVIEERKRRQEGRDREGFDE